MGFQQRERQRWRPLVEAPPRSLSFRDADRGGENGLKSTRSETSESGSVIQRKVAATPGFH